MAQSQPDAQPDEPDAIADLPKPWYELFVKPTAEWYLSLSTSDASTVRTSKSIQVCSHCQQVWGLLSDYHNPKQPNKDECVHNLGIALSEKKEARMMVLLTSASPDWKQLITFLAPEFERAESVGLAGTVSQYAAQLPPAEERAKVALSMLNLYRSQLADGKMIFYFEASKEYPKPRAANDAGCNNISLLGGWIHGAHCFANDLQCARLADYQVVWHHVGVFEDEFDRLACLHYNHILVVGHAFQQCANTDDAHAQI